jgi:DNA-binding NtrC family response regulator
MISHTKTQRCWSLGIGRGFIRVSTNDRIVSIIDDELDITELFRDAIGGSIDGILVVTFNDPVLALEHFTENKQHYVLVISDLRMPSLNGLELLKRIKHSSPNVRTILMSAYNFELDKLYQTYLKEGIIDSSIEKPVTLDALCQRVRDEFQVYQLKSHLR